MRDDRTIIIPVPKRRNTHVKVEINGIDVTRYVYTSYWKKPVTDGIGTFYVKILSMTAFSSFRAGTNVKFYADNEDGTTLQFWGRITNISKSSIRDNPFLDIQGMHRSYFLVKSLISYSGSGTTSDLLKVIINKLPASYGFTYTNVEETTDNLSVEWSYKPFLECVTELCNYAGYDFYVDDTLDFHYFESNSIANNNEAVVQFNNLLNSSGWGIDEYYQITRVTIQGENADGLPIIYTAIDPEESADGIEEAFYKVTAANTEDKVKALAESKLSQLTNIAPTAELISFGLETVNPGDNIWVVIPEQKISGQYKINSITHGYGVAESGWVTSITIEQDIGGASYVYKVLSEANSNIIESGNPNKLDYTWLTEFNSDIGTHDSTEITGGVLKTTGIPGTWISPTKTLNKESTQFQLKVVGENLVGVIYYISTNGGAIYTPIQKDTLTTLSAGTNTRLKIYLQYNTTISSIAILYS